MRVATTILRTLPFLNCSAVADGVIRACAGAPGALVRRLEARRLRGVHELRRVLVIADTNIGDSILLQPVIPALRRRFPGIEIDYAHNVKTAELIGPETLLRRSLPVLRSAETDRAENAAAIRTALARHRYDLVINFCPFLSAADLGAPNCFVMTPLSMTVGVLAACRDGGTAAIPSQVDALVARLGSAVSARVQEEPNPIDRTTGARVYVSDARMTAMRRFLEGSGFGPDDRVALVNPDTSNTSTYLGGRLFTRLARRMLESGEIDGVVIARAFNFRGVERAMLRQLRATGHADRVRLAPENLSLAGLAALVDNCVVYVGGDTGPLHLAAARKVSPTSGMAHRNRTVVVGLFKATDPRIYGYDSRREGMIGSFQDAPAISYESRPSCKNATCSIQRITKTCPARACHHAIDVDAVAAPMIAALREMRTGRASLQRVVPFPKRPVSGERAVRRVGERDGPL